MRLRAKKRVEVPSPLAGEGERRPVLIVSGPQADARRYRGDHRKEQLEAAGIETDICYRHEVELASLSDRYECFVLYRVEMDDDVARLVEAARSRVVCDFDDLVFDPGAAPWLRALAAFSSSDRESFVAGMKRQRQTLAACGLATVSTDPLATNAATVAAGVGVVHNAVSEEMVRQADEVRRGRRRRRGRRVRVGYLSGTATHDRDFLEAADAVLACLAAHRQVQFVAAGFLTLDARFDRFADRIERIAYMPWRRLPQLQATLDVNLAPLERGNPFTESKSCLKFLEAAVVGVPTIASARADFVRVIEQRENGILADDRDAWREGLLELVEDDGARAAMGEHARADVVARHTTAATADAAADALEALVPQLSPWRVRT